MPPHARSRRPGVRPPRMTRPMRPLTPSRWCVVAVVLAAVLSLPSLSGGAPANSDGLAAYFDAAEGKSPLDIFGVRFGQTASTDLTLIIRTHKPWETGAINPRFGRTLCILLRSDEHPLPAGRLCAYPSESAKSGLALRYTVLDPQTGIQRGIRDLSPIVSRPSKTTIRVSFPPSLLRLKPGLYHWIARSQYRDEADLPAARRLRGLPAEHGRGRDAGHAVDLAGSPPALLRRRLARPAQAVSQPEARARRRADARQRRPHAEHPLHAAQADRARHPVRVRRARAGSAQHGRAHRRQPRRPLARRARDRRPDREVAGRLGHALGLPVHARDRPPRPGEPPQRLRELEQAGPAMAGGQPEDQHGLRRRALRLDGRRQGPGQPVQGEDVGLLAGLGGACRGPSSASSSSATRRSPRRTR